MKSFVWLVAISCLLLSGCEQKDRDTIAREGSTALQHAAAAAMTAWQSVSKKVSEISPESTEAAMNSARSAVEGVQKKLAEVPNPTPEIQKQIEAARASIAKIDAAATLRELQDKTNAMVESAKQQAENAGKTAEEVREKLNAASDEYRALSKRIDDANRNYEDATRRFDSLKGQVQ